MTSKNIIFTIVFFLVVIFSSLAQNGIKAVFAKTTHQSLIDLNNSNAHTVYMQKLRFSFLYRDAIASYRYFKPNTKIKNDYTTLNALTFTKFNGPYIYNLKEKKVFRKKGKFLLEKRFNDFNWYLEDDMKFINDLTCYKATTNIIITQTDRKGNNYQFEELVVAWYTTDICVSAGPDGFAGLPGLIVKLEIRDEITELESIEFNQNIPEIKLPLYKEKMTETEFKAHTKSILDKINDAKGDH